MIKGRFIWPTVEPTTQSGLEKGTAAGKHEQCEAGAQFHRIDGAENSVGRRGRLVLQRHDGCPQAGAENGMGEIGLRLRKRAERVTLRHRALTEAAS